MGTLPEVRQTLYATMRRYARTTGAMTPEALLAFFASDAYHAYQNAERVAAEERDPEAVTRQVAQMNAIIDGIQGEEPTHDDHHHPAQ